MTRNDKLNLSIIKILNEKILDCLDESDNFTELQIKNGKLD